MTRQTICVFLISVVTFAGGLVLGRNWPSRAATPDSAGAVGARGALMPGKRKPPLPAITTTLDLVETQAAIDAATQLDPMRRRSVSDRSPRRRVLKASGMC